MGAWRLLPLVVVLLFGCADGDAASSSGRIPVTTGLGTASDQDRLVDSILEDGVVTESELERAILATASCIKDAGFVVNGPAWDELRRHFAFTFTDPSLELDLARADECERPFSSVVQEWSRTMQRTIEEDQEVWDEFASCLSEVAGEQVVGDHDELTERMHELDAVFLCVHPNAVVTYGP